MAVRVFERRGLSPVLTMAFIVVGVIVGVVLLWAFASKSIERGEDVIDPDCFTVDLDVVSCNAYGTCNYEIGTGSYNADILVNRGIGRADLSGLRFAFEDIYGRKGVHDIDLATLFPLEELQSLQFEDPFRIPVVSFEPYLVRVIALIDSKKKVCPLVSEPVFCNTAQPKPPIGPNSAQGQCCQQIPWNLNECYNGLDPNYPIINGVVNYITGTGSPSPYSPISPPGNNTICCGAFTPSNN